MAAPGRCSQTPFALGYSLSGFQPFRVRRWVRLNEQRETLQPRGSGEFKAFADEELGTVLTLRAASVESATARAATKPSSPGGNQAVS
jgi:hypothetical protein